MTLLATPEELAAVLGVTVDEAFTARATILLELASGEVRTYLGQTLDYVDADTFELDGRGRRAIALPELPVVAVLSIAETVRGTVTSLVEGTDYHLDLGRDGRLGLIHRIPRGRRWPTGHPDIITVVYAHGYELPAAAEPPAAPANPFEPAAAVPSYTPDPLPATIRSAVIRAAARSLANPTGVRSETVGRWSATYGTADNAGVYLTPNDEANLAYYRAGSSGGSR